jgi:hypothetical protein
MKDKEIVILKSRPFRGAPTAVILNKPDETGKGKENEGRDVGVVWKRRRVRKHNSLGA